MSENHIKTNLKASHEAHNRYQAGKRGLLLSFIIFMAWVAAIGFLISLITCQPVNAKQIATDTNNGYYIDLSRKHASGKSNRYSLAFFVPDNSAASQAVLIQSSTAPPVQISTKEGQTIIFIADHLLTDYDGLTLQNRTAEKRICRAVACVTESKTRHPISLWYSVAFTQKLTQGVIHHG
jgi:hypothetical protein